MPSNIFTLKDKRYLIGAYADGLTHGAMNAFESSFPSFFPPDASKAERATAFINYLFGQPNTDEAVLELLNYVYVENIYGDVAMSKPPYTALQRNVLKRTGIVLTDNGFEVQSSNTGLSQEPSQSAQGGSGGTGFARGVTAFLNVSDAEEKPVLPPQVSNRAVFVVHGRDMRPVEQIETFLVFLGLTMMTWSDAVKLTGESQPHTYDIVKAGMDNAAAVVVIFSPDDEARVKRQFASTGENTDPMGQARQNVLVEAGMAFAQSRKKTIFVQSEHTRPITDLEGFNWVKLNGEWDSRKDFIHRLEAAGAEPKPISEQLTHRTAGAFKIV